MWPRMSLACLLLACVTPLRAADAPRYALRYDAQARSMQVALCIDHAMPMARFVSSGEAADAMEAPTREHAALERDDDAWIARDWHAGECLRYRVALGRLADANSRHGRARGGDVVTDPSAWLLRLAGGEAAEARVELPPGYAISAPWQPLPADGHTMRFRVAATPPDWMARVAVGTFAPPRTLALGNARLHVAILDGADDAQRTRLFDWLQRVGRAALSAYGRLPQADVQVLVIPVGAQREAVVFGQSTRGQGQGLTLFVDPAQAAAAFERDWVAVHELSHLLHPYLGDRGAWLAEGLATYYQNVLRARAGLLTPAQAWSQLDDGFRRGRAQTDGAASLDEAAMRMGEQHAFQRVYWSGTAFWLEADVALRRASANRLGIDEALSRFAACCLPGERRWAPQAFVARLDALTGSDVFTTTFERYHARRDFPDLASIYAGLGLLRNGEAVRLDDAAPEADIRRAIMREAGRSGAGRVSRAASAQH